MSERRRFSMNVAGSYLMTGRGLVVQGIPSDKPTCGGATLVFPGRGSQRVTIVGVERFCIEWSNGQPAGLLLAEVTAVPDGSLIVVEEEADGGRGGE